MQVDTYLDEDAVAKHEHRVQIHRSHILSRLPPLEPWIIERRFHAGPTALVVSDWLDREHPDNPHVKAGLVSRRSPDGSPAWFEVSFPWEEAEAAFDREAIREIKNTAYKYIIQRPVA